MGDTGGGGGGDCNEFLQQFNQLTFDNKGIPQTYNNVKNTVKLFNNLNIIDESSFNKDSDGRYGVVSDMTHINMEPDFNSKTKGFNPMLKEQWDKM
jgi:plastocyanin domain-containing protein